MSEDVIVVRDLVKRFGDLVALDGLSFGVRRGEIFGLLGPNGAGKTTTLEILEGLQEADSGDVIVLGDRRVPGDSVKRDHQHKLGVLLQETLLFRDAKVREILKLFSSFYDNALPTAALAASVGLADKLGTEVGRLSGGQRQRLALALALINDPAVLILDEPSTGLDPQSRLRVFGLLTELRERGRTVLLTTHLMEEAEKLCDRVAIVNHGRVLACDTPAALKERFELVSVVEIQVDSAVTVDEERIRASGVAVTDVVRSNGALKIFSPAPYHVLGNIRDVLPVESLGQVVVHAATLEDVFLKLVGKEIPR